jgi:IS30 family transposase
MQHLSDRIKFIKKYFYKRVLQNMEKFQQLSYHERYKIYRGLMEQKSIRKIAKTIERPASTISREIKRNSDKYGYLYPGDAHKAAQDRKHITKPKIDKKIKLQDYVKEKLKSKWSPDTIAGRWSLKNPEESVCRETIYRWLYRSNDLEKKELRSLLPRAHKKRGFRSKPARSNIKNKVSIHERPNNINNRSEAGHYECDLVFNQGSASKNICTLIERVTRKCIIIRNENKSTKTVIDGIIEHITKEGIVIKSITFDNGTEFAGHERFNKMGIKTYFCEPAKPYQKGAIEHLNGMIRRYLPFNLAASSITKEYVEQINIIMNNIPRKILGYKTPMEMQKQPVPNQESRVKLATPAMEAVFFNEKTLSVAFRC